jgi:hypothetical protein
MTITQSFSKLSAVAAGIAVAFALLAGVFATATPARAASLTSAQVSSIISLLQSFGADAATIANVQASLTGGTPTTPTTPSTGGSCPALTRDIQAGSTGADVMSFQKFLNSNAATQVAVSGAGSPGNETSTFGPATKAAAIKLQVKLGVTPAAGYVGAKTRAAIAATCGGTTTNPGTPTGSLMVGAGAQPANAIAPESAARVPFTRFTLSNNSSAVVTVNGVTVQRTGFAANSAFAGVALVDSSNVQYGNSKTLNSNNQATIGDTFTINPGETKTFTVVGNMDADLDQESGQIASFSVVAINSSATVGGSLPIMGASHTINSTLAIGGASAAISSYDPNSSGLTKSIGDTGVKFAGVRVTAGSVEADRLWTVRWNQSGSAGAGDLANVMTYVDGTSYPTTVSADGKYYTTTFPGGLLIDKGLSKDIYVQADVVGSSVSGRTVEFDVYKGTDIFLTGETYGYGVTLTNPNGLTNTAASGGSEFVGPALTPGTPFFSGSSITINPGSATSISRATSVTAQNAAVNVPNQVLGGFTTNFTGEPVSVQTMNIYFNYGTTAAASGNVLTGLNLVDENGAVVSTGNDGVVVGGKAQKVTFSDTVTFPTGMHTYTIKGKVASSLPNNETIIASTTPSSDWTGVTGQTSGSTVSLTGNGLFSMSPVTVKGATLAVTLSTTPASASIVSGGTVTFANLQLDASQSGEDVRISKALFDVAASVSLTGVSTCQLWDGSSVVSSGSNAPTTLAASANSFTFNNPLVVPKGTIKTLTLSCNVSSAASGTFTFALDSTDWSAVSATGALSGNSLTTGNGLLTVASGNAGTMSVGSQGTLAVTLDSSSPSYALAANGSTGVTLGVLRFAATNEDINLKQVALQLTGPAASSSPADLNQVTLWDGSTQIGTATFTGSNRNATSSLNTPIKITAGSYKLVTVKADLPLLNSNAGIGNNPKPGARVKVDYDGDSSTGTQGQGVSSGATINATGSDTASNGVRVFKSYPIITYAPTAGALTNGTNPLATVTVNANSTGDVTLYKLTFAIATTAAQLASPTFTGPNGSVGASAPTISADGSTLTVTFDSGSNTQDKTIAAGTSKTYTIGATVSGLTGSTAGVASFSLKADSAYPSFTSALMGQTGDLSSNNIIWSPNSTTTAATTNNDWTNGYGLGGCFATSGLGQNCFAATKAQ